MIKYSYLIIIIIWFNNCLFFAHHYISGILISPYTHTLIYIHTHTNKHAHTRASAHTHTYTYTRAH